MTSAPIRDPLADHLITPQNAALLLIDYQPAQVASVRSSDHELLAGCRWLASFSATGLARTPSLMWSRSSSPTARQWRRS